MKAILIYSGGLDSTTQSVTMRMTKRTNYDIRIASIVVTVVED